MKEENGERRSYSIEWLRTEMEKLEKEKKFYCIKESIDVIIIKFIFFPRTFVY